MRIFVSVPGVVGTATIEGFKDQIECQSMSYERRVRDPQGAAPATKPPPRPIVLVKAFDRSTPYLGDALVTPTTFPKVTITCAADVDAVRVSTQLVLELTNAQVRKIDHVIAEGGASLPVERLELTYTALLLTYSPAGVAAKAVTA